MITAVVLVAIIALVTALAATLITPLFIAWAGLGITLGGCAGWAIKRK